VIPSSTTAAELTDLIRERIARAFLRTSVAA